MTKGTMTSARFRTGNSSRSSSLVNFTSLELSAISNGASPREKLTHRTVAGGSVISARLSDQTDTTGTIAAILPFTTTTMIGMFRKFDISFTTAPGITNHESGITVISRRWRKVPRVFLDAQIV